MKKVLKGLCFGVLGGVLACGLTLLLAFGYSYDSLTGGFIIKALLVGAGLGFVAGAVWGSAATKWMLEALMNL
jgi:cell division protein FtsX